MRSSERKNYNHAAQSAHTLSAVTGISLDKPDHNHNTHFPRRKNQSRSQRLHRTIMINKIDFFAILSFVLFIEV